MSSWEIILRVSQRQYSTLSTQSFYPLLAISRPSWLFQLSQKQLNFLIHLSPFSFFLKNVLATFFSFFLSPFSMILFKKWLSPYSYISHCFLFSDSANMQNFYSLFQYFLSYPYHPLSDFFKGREVTVGIDFFHPLILVMWLHLSTRMLAFEVADGQVPWSFLAAFFPWALCDIYFVGQHFLIPLSLASGSLGPLPFSFQHPICSSFCLDSALGFIYIWCPRRSSKFFFKSPLWFLLFYLIPF